VNVGQEVWETEDSDLGTNDSSWSNGLGWAQQIHKFLATADVNSWHYGWGVDEGDGTGQGLITAGTAEKRMLGSRELEQFRQARLGSHGRELFWKRLRWIPTIGFQKSCQRCLRHRCDQHDVIIADVHFQRGAFRCSYGDTVCDEREPELGCCGSNWSQSRLVQCNGRRIERDVICRSLDVSFARAHNTPLNCVGQTGQLRIRNKFLVLLVLKLPRSPFLDTPSERQPPKAMARRNRIRAWKPN
jgi:hypothetical protein